MFVIEDQIHAEVIGSYEARSDAVAELGRLAVLAWDKNPNRAPCSSWDTCGREYELVHYDQASSPWTELERVPALNVSATKTEWLLEPSMPPS